MTIPYGVQRRGPKQSIALPVPPSSNDRLVPGRHSADGRLRMFFAGPVRKYRRGIAQLIQFLKPVPAPRGVRVSIVWHCLEGDGDLDNRLKIALDVLSGHAYDDDAQISELHVTRLIVERNPILAITIEDLSTGGHSVA